MAQVEAIFSKEAEKQLIVVNKRIDDILESVEKLSKNQVNFNTKSFKDYNKAVNNQKKGLSDLEKEQAKLQKAEARLAFTQSDRGKQLAKTNELIKAQNAENRKTQKELAGLNSSYDRLGVSLKEAEKEYRDLAVSQGINADTTKLAQKRVQELRAEVDGINEPIKRFGDDVGNYKSAFDAVLPQFSAFTAGLEKFGISQDEISSGSTGLTKGLTNIKSGLAGAAKAALNFVKTPIGAAITALVGIGVAVKQFIAFNREVAKSNLIVEQLANTTGRATDQLREQATAIQKTFNRDFNETVKELSELQRDFGINAEEAFNIYLDGLVRGGNESNEFGDSIREYGGLFAEAGFSAQEFVDVLNAGIDLGIYNDKLPDAIKEAGLSLREQTQSTKDALTNAFGASFSQELLDGVSDGSKTIKEALQDIAEESEKVQLSEQQLAQLTADVFRGAGEDAGGALKVFEAINKSLQIQNEEYTDLQKAISVSTQLTNELEAAKTRAFKSDDAVAFGQLISNTFTKLKISVIDDIANLRQDFENFVFSVKDGFAQLEITLTTFPRLVSAVFKDVQSIVRNAAENISEYIETIQKFAKGDFQGARNNLNFIKEQSVGFEFTKNTLKEIQQLRNDATKQLLDESIKQKNILIEQAEFEKEQTEKTGNNPGAEKVKKDLLDVSALIAQIAQENSEQLNQIQDDIVEAYKNGTITAKELLQQLADAQIGIQDEVVTETIEALNEQLNEYDLTAEEIKSIQESLYDFEQQLREKNLEELKLFAQKRIDIETSTAEEFAKISQDSLDEEQARREANIVKVKGGTDDLLKDQEEKEREAQAIKEEIQAVGFEVLNLAADEFFERGKERRNTEIEEIQEEEALKIAYIEELEQQGVITSEEASQRKKNAEIEAAREVAKIKREQAVADKNQALFNIAINTAAAAIATLAQTPLPLGAIPLAATIALGTAQALAVASRPIPKFRTGTKDSPEGLAIVGDGGSELVDLPDGSSFLADKEMMTYLPQHSVVHTAKETKEILQNRELVKEMKGMRKEIRKNKPIVNVYNNTKNNIHTTRR